MDHKRQSAAIQKKGANYCFTNKRSSNISACKQSKQFMHEGERNSSKNQQDRKAGQRGWKSPSNYGITEADKNVSKSRAATKLFSTANFQNNTSNIKKFSPDQRQSAKKNQKVVCRADQIVTASTQSDEGFKINDLIQNALFEDQQTVNKIFEKELKFVYSEIDKASDLLWAQQDEEELIRYRNQFGSRINTRKQLGEGEEAAPKYTGFERESNASIGYGEITRGAFTTFLSICQNIDKYIKIQCKKGGHDTKKLPFKLDQYNIVTKKSTFLDIGSGFGKPNFHVALQIYPKESIGVEVLQARVVYSQDQKYEFEEIYNKKAKLRNSTKVSAVKADNSQSRDTFGFQPSNSCSYVDSMLLSQIPQDDIQSLKLIDKNVDSLGDQLRESGLIKGNANALAKIKHDVNVRMKKINDLTNNVPSNSQFQKSDDIPKLMAHYRDDWCQLVQFQYADAAQGVTKYLDSEGKDISHIYSYNKVMSLADRRDISKILNRTNFKLMAWYFGPRESAQCGLKRVRLAYQMPMQSTGKQKFSVYIYYKTQLYDENEPWSEDESDLEISTESQTQKNQEEKIQQIQKRSHKKKREIKSKDKKKPNVIEIDKSILKLTKSKSSQPKSSDLGQIRISLKRTKSLESASCSKTKKQKS